LHVVPEAGGGVTQSPPGAVSVPNHDGGLWIEDCVFTGAPASPAVPGDPGAEALNGLSVEFTDKLTLLRCTIAGGDGVDEVPGVSFARGGAHGFVSNGFLGSCSVAIGECALQGGRGGSGSTGSLSETAGGGVGIAFGFTDGSVLGGTALGGDDDDEPGPGASLFGVDATLRDTDIQAGALTGVGVPAEDIASALSTVTTFPAPLRSMSLPCPVREGDTPALQVVGLPGDGVFVHLSLDVGWLKVAKGQGTYTLGALVGAPFLAGTITDPSGTLDVGVHMPELPPGIDGLVAFLQPVMAPTGGGAVLGTGTALVWIDSAL
jgi:hypothetical protein